VVEVTVDKDGVRSAVIIFCGLDVRVACDGKCHKAWGWNNRPKVNLSDTDEDDIAWMSDDELGRAPDNPGTYEGGHGKPPSSKMFPNKWCVRECERCFMSDPGNSHIEVKSGDLPDYSKRHYNKAPHTRD